MLNSTHLEAMDLKLDLIVAKLDNRRAEAAAHAQEASVAAREAATEAAGRAAEEVAEEEIQEGEMEEEKVEDSAVDVGSVGVAYCIEKSKATFACQTVQASRLPARHRCRTLQ